MAGNSIFGLHAQALELRAKRAELLARNLANADTPNYKARDMDFSSVLGAAQNAQSVRLNRTSGQHLQGVNATGSLGVDLKYRIPAQPALDGNTVDAQVEKSEFADNAVRYLASMNFLNMRIKGLIRTLREE